MYDPTDIESCLGYAAYQDDSNQLDLDNALGMPFFIVGDEVHNFYAKRAMNYPDWLRKIKGAFDPNGVSDPSHYVKGVEKKK